MAAASHPEPDNRLEPADFLARLAELFKKPQEDARGSIYLTQKRILEAEDPAATRNVLIRATNGKSKRSRTDKVKLSTVVQPDDLENFFTKYAECCKAGMQGLRKRDRKAKRKDKGKKKKGAAEANGKA